MATRSTGSDSPLLEAQPSPCDRISHQQRIVFPGAKPCKLVDHEDNISDTDATRLPMLDETFQSESITDNMLSREPDTARVSPTAVKRSAPRSSQSLRGIEHTSPLLPQTASTFADDFEWRSPEISPIAKGNSTVTYRGVPSSAVNRGEKSGILAWHELERIVSYDGGTTFWPQLLANLNPQSEDWSSQTTALTTVRRLALHHPNKLECTVMNRSVGPLILARVVSLADSLRSVVARNAMLTLNDLFLFAPAQVDSAAVVDSVALCLRKAAGPGGQFLIEEAERAWRQMVLVAEHMKIYTYLGTTLSKITKSNAMLKAKCINALAFFCLRLAAPALRAISDHKDFANNVVRVIFKATGDAHQECRGAAARCLIVLLNLIPDLQQRYRSALIDIDLSQIISRMRRTSFDVKTLYGISQLEESYRTLPSCAMADRAQLNLQIMLDNVDSILKHPLHLSGTPSAAKRANAAAKTTRMSMDTRAGQRVETPLRLRDTHSTAPSPRSGSAVPVREGKASDLMRSKSRSDIPNSNVGGGGRCTSRPATATPYHNNVTRLANPVCSTRPTTPVRVRDLTSTQSAQRPRASSQLRSDQAQRLETRGFDPNVSSWLPEEEAEEDTPWCTRASTATAGRRTPNRRDTTTTRTPVRARTPLENQMMGGLTTQNSVGRPGATTPTLAATQRASTRPRSAVEPLATAVAAGTIRVPRRVVGYSSGSAEQPVASSRTTVSPIADRSSSLMKRRW